WCLFRSIWPLLACVALQQTTVGSLVGSRTGAVPVKARFQPPPHQTRRADFQHRAFLVARGHGLWELSPGSPSARRATPPLPADVRPSPRRKASASGLAD